MPAVLYKKKHWSCCDTLLFCGKQAAVQNQQEQEEMAKKMEVCETCGALLVSNDAQQRIDEHIMGKQHMGYARIRACVEGRKVY